MYQKKKTKYCKHCKAHREFNDNMSGDCKTCGYSIEDDYQDLEDNDDDLVWQDEDFASRQKFEDTHKY